MRRITVRPVESSFFSDIAGITSASEIQKMFGELFTHGELRDLALRWKIMRLLVGGATQRKIAGDLRVSLCKITRGARVLKESGSICKRILSAKDTNGTSIRDSYPDRDT